MICFLNSKKTCPAITRRPPRNRGYLGVLQTTHPVSDLSLSLSLSQNPFIFCILNAFFLSLYIRGYLCVNICFNFLISLKLGKIINNYIILLTSSLVMFLIKLLLCLPPPDSVGIKDKIKSVLHKLSFEDFEPSLLIQFWAAITTGGQCSLTTMQDVKMADIKVAYTDGTLIRFKLPSTAGMVKLEEEIVKRLKFLQVGCFEVTYLDEENDSILLACDSDLQNYINTSIASGITKIRMFIRQR
ncbi:hypothetical protein F0562_032482 [Nyssa sinensis]|uniref:PB1 domain-containing protein n=1 Tax=Nyssa sinensis TaxID=561372 RepID=A0A5J5AQA9_9ASTE|nr:hypothetical protein F0562_032482 [Nyssa sinensis]